jgi:hypothetical protein
VTGDLDIRESLTILGAGSGLSIIDANALDRVFHVRAGISAAISDVTIRGGMMSDNSWGGGILIDNGASLNLSRVVITDNSTGSGAGIYNYGTLVATDTVISNNIADKWGGGLYNDRGNVTLNRVTISGNSAGKDGGGINNGGSGASMSLTNVTLSGNTASEKGGGIWTSRAMTVANSTIAFNDAEEGDGIFSQGGGAAVSLKNTVLYNPAGVNANRGMTSLGHNIDSDGTAALIGSGDLVADPLLAPLASNGGLTPTHALLAASPAINAGTAAGSPGTDQRGASRLSITDIGAFEYTVIGYEPFNYSAGSFNGANGGSGWATGWSNVGSSTTIVATGLQNPSAVMPVSGGAAQLAIPFVLGDVTQTRNLTTTIGLASTTTWLSFLLSPASILPGDSMGVQFGSSSGAMAFAGYNGNAFVLERVGGSGRVIVSGITPSPGQTYLLTVKMEFTDGADAITLYVNPTPGLAEPNSPFTATKSNLDLGTFTEIGLSGGRLLLNNNSRLDELRIGSSFSDVAPSQLTSPNTAPVIISNGGGATASISVAENTTAVTTVTATDANVPTQTLTYSISGGSDAAKFTIDSSTGVLRFVAPPDAESPADDDRNNVYRVTVRVTDGNLTDSQTISVTVTDVDEFDVGPVSNINTAQNAVTENAANGTTVGITARAIDPDITNNTITYGLTDSAEGRFAINAASGVVTVADGARLDRESAESHNITVRATSSDGSSSTQTFMINLLPVNDNRPVITSNGGGATAAISVAENTTTVTTVTATDADLPAQTLTYSISGGSDAARFTIDSLTGVLRFVAPPDAESPTDRGRNNVYQVTVMVTDGTLTDSQEISVTVTDVNEFDVGPVSDINAAPNAVAENAANGTAVGITARAIDADITNNTITYSLADSAAGRFAVNALTGVVTVADGARLDRESAESHNITVRATSSDGSSSTQTFTISLLPVNDNRPVITSNGGGATAAISVAENTTTVTTVTATDADLPAQTLTYSISGGIDANRFTIDSSTGVLRFISAPNFESPTDADRDNIYSVVVQASDGTLTSTQVLAVTVTNVNEAPTVTGRVFQTKADQPLIISAPGLLATAFDPDGDVVQIIVVQGPLHGRFFSQPDGTFRYEPARGYSGRDTFLFAVSDGALLSEVASAQIDVLNAPSSLSFSQSGDLSGSSTTSLSDSASSTTIATSATPLNAGSTAGPANTSTPPFAANAKPSSPVSSSDQELTLLTVFNGPDLGADATTIPLPTTSPDLTIEFGGERAHGKLTNSVRHSDTLESTDRAVAHRTPMSAEVRREALYQQLTQDGQVWQQLDSFHEQLSESTQRDAVVVGSVGVVGTGLSVGYLIWMVRFGTILSGLLAQVPAWTLLDPLLVVDGQSEDEDQESIQTIVDQQPSRPAGIRTASIEPTGNDHSPNHRDESSHRC